jgi:hypothetical protein
MPGKSIWVERSCTHCGKSFLVNPYRAKKGGGKFCSIRCRRPHSTEGRFWAKVAKGDGCWLWTGALAVGGYGRFSLSGDCRVLAHRMAWELTHGPIPDGLDVLHSCDANYPPGDITNRRCCNPAHLGLGNQAENNAHMFRTGRAKFPHGSRHGCARLTEEQIIEIRRRYVRNSRTSGLRQLASDFGVDSTMISLIVRRKNWQHV